MLELWVKTSKVQMIIHLWCLPARDQYVCKTEAYLLNLVPPCAQHPITDYEYNLCLKASIVNRDRRQTGHNFYFRSRELRHRFQSSLKNFRKCQNQALKAHKQVKSLLLPSQTSRRLLQGW